MRFGKELKASIVQAWRNKYVRYAELKVKLKELRKLYEDKGIPIDLVDEDNVNEMDMPKYLKRDTTLMTIRNDTTHKEFLSHMEQLKISSSHPSMQRDESIIEFVDYPSDQNYIDDEDEGSAESKINNDQQQQQQHNNRYTFTRVATVIEPDLESKIPYINIFEIRAKEREIVVLLEQDIYTVSKFYAQQCRYFAEQHNALIIRIQLLLQKQQE